jgi:surface antigen
MFKPTKLVLGSLAVILALAIQPAAARAAQPWQCVPFARLVSGIQIFGDAHTWWRQAGGKYDTGTAPTVGSVLVFKPQGAMRLGHVAVVSKIVTERVIQITHANWSRINGTRGQVEEDVTVVDVSAKGDWSDVKVWYDPIGSLGSSVYPTYGFIYPDQKALMMASAVRGVQTGVQGAVDVVTASGEALTQSTDRLAALIQTSLSGDAQKTK